MNHYPAQHLHDADPPRHTPHKTLPRRWGEEELQKLADLRAAGHDIAYIAGTLRRTERQVRDRIKWQEMPEYKRAQRRAQINAWRNARGEYKSVVHTEKSSFSKATPSQLAERDARLLAPRTLTAIAMGDPAPGFSALDKRGAP